MACASYKSDGKFSLTKDVPYGDHERHRGDLYQSKDKNAPMVIIVHGGGWSGRSKDDMRLIAESLATNGFHVFNINYRLAPKHKHPAPIEDLGLAIDFVSKNYEFKGDKVGLWGYSAGGHITMLHALQNNNVAAIVAGGTPYDLSWYAHSPYIVPYLGFDLEGNIQKYKEASPVHYLHEGAPPMFLYHAIKDELVEHAQMRSFYALAKLKNIDVKNNINLYFGYKTNKDIEVKKKLIK